LSIEKDAQNNLVIGTHSGGLSIISPEGKISNYNITDNDSGIIIFNTHIDQAGRIWVICNMGIFMFQNKQFIPVQLSESYSGISNFDWLEDEAGNVWITTNRGLIHIKKEEIDQFLADPSYKMASRLINKSDGMVNEECTGAVRSLQSHTGELYIPTIGGVSVIAPDKMKVNTIVPEVYITSLAADTVVYNNSDVTIPPGKSRYILNFTALSFISPSEITFKYKLEGFDEDYLFASNERTVEYTNLPPGEYTFYVQASNNDGIWNEEGDVFTFTVDAFYYETAWFYLTLILVVALLLWGIYKWRIHGIQKMNEKLRKVNSELDSFVYSASHDLRSPLTSLLGLIDLTKKDKANAEIYLEKMRSSVKKLDAFISDIIDFSSNDRKEIESKEIDFEKITEQVVNELEYLNRDGKIEVTKKINTGSGFISDSRRIAIVLRNLVSNALKYKDPKKENPYVSIDISTSPAPHRVKIVVEDNGVGIEKSDQQDVFKMFYRANEYSSGSGIGLYIVKETVEKLNGTLELQSTPGEGTKFTITLPSH
ncbi:MAG: ATP-binding protein, partial [Fulvivirga sp.]|nr:ATP-binding protein [Fulvivirga sp.]